MAPSSRRRPEDRDRRAIGNSGVGYHQVSQRLRLGAANLTLKVVPYSATYPDGGSPGIVGGDETESDLDIEWSGAVAPNATVVFVIQVTYGRLPSMPSIRISPRC